MKTTIGNITVEGTPQEIFELQGLQGKTSTKIASRPAELEEPMDEYQRLLRDRSWSIREIAKKYGKGYHPVRLDRLALKKQSIIDWKKSSRKVSGIVHENRSQKTSSLERRIRKYCITKNIAYDAYLRDLKNPTLNSEDITKKHNLSGKWNCVSLHRNLMRKAGALTFRYAKSPRFHEVKAQWAKRAAIAKKAYREGKYKTYREAIKATFQGKEI